MERSLVNESLQKNLSILGVPKMQVGSEPEKNTIYQIDFRKNGFLFQLM